MDRIDKTRHAFADQRLSPARTDRRIAMHRLKLGIALETVGLPIRRALRAAAGLAVQGVRAAAAGDLAPGRLTGTGRREFTNLLHSHALELSALSCPLRLGLDATEDVQQRVDHVQSAMQLASDLGCGTVTVPIPNLSSGSGLPRAAVMREALQALGAFGDRIGTHLALRVDTTTGDEIRTYLETFDTGSLGVDFDPANLMLAGIEPFGSLLSLAGRLAHAHARDVDLEAGTRGREAPVGRGNVDWAAYVATLEAIGYQGHLVVDREDGTERFADVTAGVQFLRRFVPDAR